MISSVIKAFGYPTNAALLSSLLMADISELSLVFMANAHGQGGLIRRRTYLLFLCTTMTSLLIVPVLHHMVPARVWAQKFRKRPGQGRHSSDADIEMTQAQEEQGAQGA